jgi:hypothetical protein
MKRFFTLITTTGLLAIAAQAAIVVTAEAPGVQQTTQAGSHLVETFDESGLPAPGNALGAYASPIGNYSAGAAMVGADAYGGSNQTQYVSIGAQQNSGLSYSLSFLSPQTYFGFYWAAGDAQNKVEFFNGATSLGSYTIGQIITDLSLGSGYNGNPNTGVNQGEKYVFLNFNSDGPMTQVSFTNNNSTATGFETDNHTILDDSVVIDAVPEPATFGLAGAALLALGLKLRKR